MSDATTAAGTVIEGSGTQGQSLADGTVIVSVRLGALRGRRRVDIEEATEAGGVKVADTVAVELLGMSKDILDSDELKAVTRHDHQTRLLVRSRAVPAVLRSGMYLVPVKSIDGDTGVEALLNERRSERAELVKAFKAALPGLRDRSITRLGPLWDESEWPTAQRVARAFYFDIRYLTFTTPSSLKGISRALWEREQDKAREQWQVAADVAIGALRSEMKGLVDNMVEQLTPGEDGKRKAFRAKSNLDNLGTFFKFFRERNVAGDAELDAVVRKAEAILDGVDVKSMKDESVRGAVNAAFTQLKGQLDALVTTAPTRQIDLDDEE